MLSSVLCQHSANSATFRYRPQGKHLISSLSAALTLRLQSLYYYDKTALPSYAYPTSINYGNWWSWNKASAYATDRAYDYVHVVAAYWALYRVARNYPSLVTQRTWQWYLNQAQQTIIRMQSGGVGYVDVGLMGETVYWYTLQDLKREGLTANVTALEAAMKRRQTIWKGQRYP